MNYIYSLMPSLIEGTRETLKIFTFTLILSLPLGILVALSRLSKSIILNSISQLYILIMRGTPLLLQLIFIFFGLPIVGIELNRGTAALTAFVLNYGAYFAEIFRGGILSIDKGQYEAAEVLGFSSYKAFIRIIFPQMIKRVLPPISNEVINLVKDSSLIYVVGIGELLRAGKIASNRDASLIPLLAVGFLYLIIIGFFTQLFKLLEKRYSYYR